MRLSWVPTISDFSLAWKLGVWGSPSTQHPKIPSASGSTRPTLL